MFVPTPKITVAIGHIGRDRIMLKALSAAAARHGARLVGHYDPARRHDDGSLPACCRDCEVTATLARAMFEGLCRAAGLADYAWQDSPRLACA